MTSFWSLDFDGVSDYIQLPEIEAVRAVSVWLRRDSIQAHGSTQTMLVTSSGLQFESTDTQGEDAWTKLCIDGIEQPVTWASVPASRWLHLHLEMPASVTIGAVFMCNWQQQNCLHGSIAETYLWQRILDSRELGIIVAGWDHSPRDTGLLGWYRIEEGEGGSLLDALEINGMAYMRGSDWALEFPEEALWQDISQQVESTEEYSPAYSQRSSPPPPPSTIYVSNDDDGELTQEVWFLALVIAAPITLLMLAAPLIRAQCRRIQHQRDGWKEAWAPGAAPREAFQDLHLVQDTTPAFSQRLFGSSKVDTIRAFEYPNSEKPLFESPKDSISDARLD
ncbi:hypothetical protein CYMTET_48757 [Cymbomonas tetramitiformis]|nr:hypothetical protein CYMTET_48757 [Cymbomonas tetramitiformis]